MKHLYPSDDDYEEINILSTMIAALKNPQVHFDLQRKPTDARYIPDAERRAEISKLEDMLWELLID